MSSHAANLPDVPSTSRTASHVPSDVDLTECDREPIHIPGAIQSHGALLALRASDLVVQQVSENAGTWLGMDHAHIVGRPLSVLLGRSQAENVGRIVEGLMANRERRSDVPLRLTLAVDGRAQLLDGSVHINADSRTVLIEVEPATPHDALSLHAFHAIVRRTIDRVRGVTSVDALAQGIAEQMRVITGYDRVWVYRFHADWHGEIIAESKRQGLDAWLGLHYPASDIPAQARALFVEHPLRLIADVDYTPSPILPTLDPETGQPLDLGGAILRSVSPVHLQYMRNMGSRASIVVSLVKDGQLWGLVSGHHASAKKLPHAMRTVCEFLGQAFAIQLVAAERTDHQDATLRVRAVAGRLIEFLAREPFPRALTTHVPSLLDLTSAEGAAIVRGSNGTSSITTHGVTPDDDAIRRLVEWLSSSRPASGGDAADTPSTPTGGAPAFCTTSLASEFPEANAYVAIASGLLAARIVPPEIAVGESTERGWLLWFRPEKRQIISWGGDPNAKVTERQADGTVRLSPRGSFDAWQQEVRGHSAPWIEEEVTGAETLAQMAGAADAWWAAGTSVEQSVTIARDLRASLDSVRALPLEDLQAAALESAVIRLDALMESLFEVSSNLRGIKGVRSPDDTGAGD